MAHTILKPTYITVQEVKDNTCIPELTGKGISEIENLIVKAQITIDSYIGEVGDKLVDDQYFKFPVVNSTDVPTNITMSTMYVVEALYGNGKKNFGKELKSESWDGYSKSFKDGDNAFKFEILSGNVRNLLKEYGINKDNLDKVAYKLNY